MLAAPSRRSLACYCHAVLQVFFYSRSIFTNAQIHVDYIPFAVMGVNAVNVAMTVIAVRSFVHSLVHCKPRRYFPIKYKLLWAVRKQLRSLSLLRQEGWLSPTERACVRYCIQSKAHYLATSRVTPVCRCLQLICGCNHLATSRASKAHFGLPWVRPWDNRSKCYMDLKRIQCLSNASQHVPIYLQPFPSNSTRKFKGSPFYHIFCTFCPPWVRS